MAKRVPFEPAHAERIRLQPRQRAAAGYATPAHYVKLALAPSISVLDGDEVLFCGGVIEMWPGRLLCWALLAESIGHRMIACVRAVRRFMAELDAPRFEMDVEVGHAEGHRFARLLGFELETPRLRAFYPDGSDGTMYVRVNP
jgi:hypothetical protein